uniref:NHS-like protein 2-like n=1 Tax=Scleropages formosus TaxID=113540 RepID=A0A8C9S4N9_SCLFO
MSTFTEIRTISLCPTGDLSVPEETLGFDLIQGVHSAEPLGARLSMPSSETCSHHVPLRKSCSNLDEGTMEHAGLMCANPSWNGPKGSTFSPSSWNDSFSSFGLVPGPVASVASPEHATGTFDSPFKGSSGHSVSSGSHSSSFASIPTESSAKTLSSPPPEAESTRGVTDGPAKSAVEKGERRSSRAGAFQFRERSLSTPTDSDSFCSADNPSATETQPESESYAPRYPSGSSEEGTSVDSVSVAALDFMPDGRPRSRSRSISLKKPKKKPLPPVRSVSLKNSLSTKVTFGDGRPRSLIITSEHLQDFQPDFIMDSKQLQNMKDFSLSNRRRASDTQAFNKEVSSSISECKLPDPVTSTASLGTAKCAARSENHNAYGQLECPISFSASQATSHSKVSAQAESKISPIKPAGLMSPSSGYSSQSETPTPTIPTSVIMGPSPLGCKMRPKIPERKSSLPATSQGDRATRSRLSIELPVTSHLDFSSIKLKPKASRRHSDSSTANKPGQKLSPSQSMMPLVTQTDLRNVRLRSVCRSEPEDNTNASSDIIAEEKHPVAAPTLTPKPKTKPPVAVKPPLPKRPPNLSLKSHSVPLSSECQPATSRDLPKPVENIYRVVKKPRAKKQPQSPLRPESVEEACQHLQQQDSDNHGPEAQSYNRTLPSRVTISSLAELDRKWKVPPPVPKKPNIIFLPVSAFPSTVSAGRLVNPPGANTVPTCPAVSGKDENRMTDGVSPPDPEQHLHRGEPVSQFLFLRQSLTSPVKSSGDTRVVSLASTPRSSSRNDTFMALLQRKNSKANGAGRVSAMELLKSTNPLARRVTEFALTEPETAGRSGPPHDH